jgi:hypothetical protein
LEPNDQDRLFRTFLSRKSVLLLYVRGCGRVDVSNVTDALCVTGVLGAPGALGVVGVPGVVGVLGVPGVPGVVGVVGVVCGRRFGKMIAI